MKKNILIVLSIAVVVVFVFAGTFFIRSGGIHIPFLVSQFDKENSCFDASYRVISDSMITNWELLFTDLGIEDSPFWYILYYIKMFEDVTQRSADECIPLLTIIETGSSNTKSNALATCAIMQSLGYDVLCFFNDEECYLGLSLDETWVVRRGNWVEKDGKNYYLKEFDLTTPVGSLLTVEPASRYLSITSTSRNLKAIPLVQSLPPFGGDLLIKKLVWNFQDSVYTVLALIPEEQVQWTGNLPPSLYGMAFSGMAELRNIGVIEQLQSIVRGMSEYDGVHCLYELCQSEIICQYDGTQPIKSVSQQLIEGRNDCDGRSVLLYALLRTVMEYDKEAIVFLSWPNHIALGVKPAEAETYERLIERQAFFADGYAILDAAYSGDTEWGDKMARLSDTCEIIR